MNPSPNVNNLVNRLLGTIQTIGVRLRVFECTQISVGFNFHFDVEYTVNDTLDVQDIGRLDYEKLGRQCA